jgi:hypothetical protein
MGPTAVKAAAGSDMLPRAREGMGPTAVRAATGATFSDSSRDGRMGAYPPQLKEIGGMETWASKVSHRPGWSEELLSRTDLDGLWDRVPEVQHVVVADWGKGNGRIARSPDSMKSVGCTNGSGPEVLAPAGGEAELLKNSAEVDLVGRTKWGKGPVGAACKETSNIIRENSPPHNQR